MDNVGLNSNEDSERFIVRVLLLLLPADTQFLGSDFRAGVLPYGSYCISLGMISENSVSSALVPYGLCAQRALLVFHTGRLQSWRQ